MYEVIQLATRQDDTEEQVDGQAGPKCLCTEYAAAWLHKEHAVRMPVEDMHRLHCMHHDD